jgi:aspartate kinase
MRTFSSSAAREMLQGSDLAVMYTRLFEPAPGVRSLCAGRLLALFVSPGNVMARLVMKFGGTSVADLDRIRNVARHVKREVDAGYDVAVVVSAMSGVTNQLVAWCRDAAILHDAREYDAVVATGEQVTAGLLAIVLEGMGVNARSWQGWQLPILTDNAHGAARIQDVNGAELIKRFKAHKQVAVIAGFQGLHEETGRVTTLGRGGSDTSAVAVAAAIGAERCDIYTDVDGVYTTDPRVVPKAHRMDKIAFEEMLELASLGAKVMQVRSVELGMLHKVRIFVRSSFVKPEDINPRANFTGTLICDESEIMEQQTVTGIAFSKDEAQISIRRVQDKPGVAAAIFGPLADGNINVDMIVQNVSADGATTDLTFTVPSADYERARMTLEKAKTAIGFERMDGATGVAKVSVIGIGMRSHAGVAAQAFKALSEQKINILAITTSEIKFSVLINAAQTDLAVRTLHTLYGLDKA